MKSFFHINFEKNLSFESRVRLVSLKKVSANFYVYNDSKFHNIIHIIKRE